MSSSTAVSSLYARLCTCSVFADVLELPIFKRFFEYSEIDSSKSKQLLAYSRFVSEIYAGGGSLTECVRRAIYENENVYVVALAHGGECNRCIALSASRELAVLSDFAALTPDDFKKDLDVQIEIPAFSSERVDFEEEYKKRISMIGKFGYGAFAAYGMFRLGDGPNPQLEPIRTPDEITVDGFIGYGEERGKLIANTEAFLSGKSAANALLYGDAGTGKSSTVKAVANLFFSEGLRLIEIRKDQLAYLPYVMGKICDNPLKFIIFIDDLSFFRSDDCFSMLKAALEGSASAKAKNAVIYATSNRRHIVRESFAERDGGEVHRNDSMQEALSLSERFGLKILFARPNQQLYLEIVRELASKRGVSIDKNELETRAEAFALARGTRSARCAEQFVDSLTV